MMLEKYGALNAALDDHLAKGEITVLAIDGMAPSGKTTLAEMLSEQYGAPVVHMDDFFLRPEQRTAARYAEPGGNFDRERFLLEVAPHLRERRGFAYRRFDCALMRLSGSVTIPPYSMIIVEGTYSLHPALAPFYSVKVMLTISEEAQKSRILKRNGEEGYRQFAEKWIPLENRYFSEFYVRNSADFVFDG